jgi:4-amino-4-deoxychorismate lyase
MARMEWHDETIFDGLLLDQQGSVIECTMSNVFARVGNTLMTPDLSLCGVSGITRQRIIGLATVLKLNVVIANISLDELLQADEVVICNSLFGAFQVSKIGNTIMPKQGLAKTIRSALAL